MNKGMVMTTIHPTYTHGYHQSVLRSHSNRTVENSAQYLSSALTPNLSVLDVGSGAGTITADIAQRVSPGQVTDRKSTRLNSSHVAISYAVFCLKKKTVGANAVTTRERH